jgi:hypothetical protein
MRFPRGDKIPRSRNSLFQASPVSAVEALISSGVSRGGEGIEKKESHGTPGMEKQ